MKIKVVHGDVSEENGIVRAYNTQIIDVDTGKPITGVVSAQIDLQPTESFLTLTFVNFEFEGTFTDERIKAIIQEEE